MTISKLINYTTREFISENELELYVSKQEEIFTPDVIKEFSIGILNGVIFAIISAIVVHIWFNDLTLSLIISISDW